jgi:hypothetical protein
VGRFMHLQDAAAVVDLWNSLPLSLCAKAVPSDIVPSDAFENHVLAFLTVEHCGLHGIPNSEFAQTMSVFSTSLPDGAEDEGDGDDDAVEPAAAASGAPPRVVDEIHPGRLAADAARSGDSGGQLQGGDSDYDDHDASTKSGAAGVAAALPSQKRASVLRFTYTDEDNGGGGGYGATGSTTAATTAAMPAAAAARGGVGESAPLLGTRHEGDDDGNEYAPLREHSHSTRY